MRRIVSPGLEARDGTIRLPGSSHAKATLASRVDVHVTDDIRVVEPLIKGGRKSSGGGDASLKHNSLLVRNGCLKETCGDAEDGE